MPLQRGRHPRTNTCRNHNVFISCRSTKLPLLSYEMKAPRLGMHLGCAVGAWNPAAAFLPLPHIPVPVPSRAPSPALRTRRSQVIRGVVKGSQCESISSSFSKSTRWRVLHTSQTVYWPPRTTRGLQSCMFMSSNPGQGLNQESFTERAWDAIVRLPALADAKQAQVTIVVYTHQLL